MIQFQAKAVGYSSSKIKSVVLPLLIALILALPGFAQKRKTIKIWSDVVPGELVEKKEHVVSENNKGNVTRLSEVTDPDLRVFKPSSSNKNGASIIVCPGGGYNILAIDHEGYEIAQWLSSLGYTAFVLHYRVPGKQQGALQDVQRAIKLVRSGARKWNLNPDKIGVLGFSAGGSLSARASTQYTYQSYPSQDKADSTSSRPDFSVLIYPAYLDKGDNRSLTPELAIDSITPPMFIFATADDYYGNSALVMAGALRDKKVPVELHFLSTGGHGYGLRKGNIAGETWPKLAEKWLKGVIE